MFVDPDDVLDREAVATHVASLQRTGSDFSVAPYRRLSRAGTWSAGWWIQQAHGTRLDRTSLADHPAIQVNAVMWSKCFRRRFWQRHDLAFPEGVLYEDQLVSAQAYALATSFDVLHRAAVQLEGPRESDLDHSASLRSPAAAGLARGCAVSPDLLDRSSASPGT